MTHPDSNLNCCELYFSCYQAWEIDISEHNGDHRIEWPIPATYIIDADATIRQAFVEMGYTQRLELYIIIEQLTAL